MIVDLKNKDPDDAFSTVPYEKGFTFLYYLEKQIGREKWDKFIPHVRRDAFYAERCVATYLALVLFNLCPQVSGLVRIQVDLVVLFLKGQRSLRVLEEPRLGYMVLRAWISSQTGLRYLPSGFLLCSSLEMGTVERRSRNGFSAEFLGYCRMGF